MEPRFTRGEYWLLETVVESLFPVSGLTDSDFEFSLNKKGHGLTRDALIETLHRLIASGLIYAENKVDAPISTHQQIERALNEPGWQVEPVEQMEPVDWRTITYYGLTPEGGAQWEAFAAPDWQEYIDASSRLTDDEEGIIWEVICVDKAWLERYFESKCFYDPEEVSLATVEWDYIAPWDATYWKQLEGGHRVRFQEQDETEAQNVRQNVRSYPLADPEWFHSLWCAWR